MAWGHGVREMIRWDSSIPRPAKTLNGCMDGCHNMSSMYVYYYAYMYVPTQALQKTLEKKVMTPVYWSTRMKWGEGGGRMNPCKV